MLNDPQLLAFFSILFSISSEGTQNTTNMSETFLYSLLKRPGSDNLIHLRRVVEKVYKYD